jgi:hypothetical protein
VLNTLTNSRWRELPPGIESAGHLGTRPNMQRPDRTRRHLTEHARTRPSTQALDRTLRDSVEHAGTRPIIPGTRPIIPGTRPMQGLDRIQLYSIHTHFIGPSQEPYFLIFVTMSSNTSLRKIMSLWILLYSLSKFFWGIIKI